ncbi:MULTISPECIES: PfkB family carbohydrate kinase [Alistipes]|nr:PfkB family carbohydrate kinase [Alistipes finegoldii]
MTESNGKESGLWLFRGSVFCAAGHYKIFDINLRQHFYSPEVVHDSLCRSNILKTNDEELTVVSRMFGIQAQEPQAQCRDLLEKYGLRTVILTCGAVGSHVFTPDGMSYVATPHVEVADGVGAGDSFTAQIRKEQAAVS